MSNWTHLVSAIALQAFLSYAFLGSFQGPFDTIVWSISKYASVHSKSSKVEEF